MNIKQTGPDGNIERITNKPEEEGGSFFTIEDVMKDVNNAPSIQAIRDLFYHTTYFGNFEEAKIYEQNLDEIIKHLDEVKMMENSPEKMATYVKIGELIKELPNSSDLQKLTVNKVRELVFVSMGLKIEKK